MQTVLNVALVGSLLAIAGCLLAIGQLRNILRKPNSGNALRTNTFKSNTPEGINDGTVRQRETEASTEAADSETAETDQDESAQDHADSQAGQQAWEVKWWREHRDKGDVFRYGRITGDRP